jgi:pimeloyl-ACP methyl ester carboxylesterase
MLKWLTLLGFALWLVGTATAVVANYGHIETTPVELSLDDGTPIHGTLFRKHSCPDQAPAALVLHGIAVSHASCTPGLAIPLARSGFVVLSIDVRGHGRSGGTLRRVDCDNLETTQNVFAGQPEIDAAIAFLQSQPSVDSGRLVLVGHSRGGWMAANAGLRRGSIASVISVSSAPSICDLKLPHNLLFLTSGLDDVIPPSQYHTAIVKAVGIESDRHPVQANEIFQGTARLMVQSPCSLHLSTLAEPTVTRRTVQWAAWSVHGDPGMVSSVPLTAIDLSVAAASLGALMALTGLLCALTNRWLAPDEPTVRFRYRRVVAVVLLAALVAAPVAAWLGNRLPDGGLMFSSHAFAMLLTAALVTTAASCMVPGRAVKQSAATIWSSWARGLLLGVLYSGLWLALFGLTFGTTWVDVVPTMDRLRATLILLAVLFPCCLLMALGTQKVMAQTPASLSGVALRGAIWLGLALAMWLGHLALVRVDQPMLGIPTLYVVGSAVVPLPLWLLRNRPGLGVARAVSHALGAACFLGLHLPFVQTG